MSCSPSSLSRAPVVGRRGVEEQTKESARRDKGRRPAIVWPSVSIVWPSTICFYCVGQNHMLVGVSLSAICFYCNNNNNNFRVSNIRVSNRHPDLQCVP